MRENVVYELEDKDGCPNCHHQVSLWLGASGTDRDGLHIAYICPNCGFETCDYVPDVDDSLPEKFAWSRNSDGSVTWYRKNMGIDIASSADLTVCAECGATMPGHYSGCSNWSRL